MRNDPPKHVRSLVLAAASLLVAAALCALAVRPPPAASSAAAPDAGGVKLTLLHVNDSHGQLSPLVVQGKQVGGVARLATALRQVRQASSANRIFLIHCGDEFSRGDALSVASAGAANIAVMNHLGFDLWVPGNGDFYDGLNVLRRRMAQGKFTALAANVSVGEQPLAPSHVILQAGPARIAFFGLCTVRESTEQRFDIQEADPIQTAKGLVAQLRGQADGAPQTRNAAFGDPDLVVAVTHLGLSEDLRLAGAVEGIDIILGAHSHTILKHGMLTKGPTGREVLIAQAGDRYRYLGQVDVELARDAPNQGFRLLRATASLIPLDESVQPDPETVALLAQLAKTATRPTSQPGATRPASRPAPTTAPALAPAIP